MGEVAYEQQRTGGLDDTVRHAYVVVPNSNAVDLPQPLVRLLGAEGYEAKIVSVGEDLVEGLAPVYGNLRAGDVVYAGANRNIARVVTQNVNDPHGIGLIMTPVREDEQRPPHAVYAGGGFNVRIYDGEAVTTLDDHIRNLTQ